MGMNGGDDDIAVERVGAGETEISLGIEHGRIVMGFPHAITWLALDPANAVTIAQEMIDRAVELGMKIDLLLPRREISPTIQAALVTRTAFVMKNLLERGRKPEHIAQELVGIVLREVT